MIILFSQHIHNNEIAEQMRESLKNFYIVIKGLDEYLKFVFFTGISKFSKTSLFSGLNNLNDISLDSKFNALVGYTYNEIAHAFNPHLIEAAHYHNFSTQVLLAKITNWYDGYLFTHDMHSAKIYNPFSVLLFLSKKQFSNYWFASGTPTFLINLLKSKNYPIQEFEQIEATESELGFFDIDIIPLKTLLFQTGYLTIHDYDKETNNFVLSFPNYETSSSLAEHIFVSMTQSSGSFLNSIAASLLKIFNQENIQELYDALTCLFALIPYTIQIGEEKYYQTIFYLILKMIGANIIVEQPTNIGRIDAVLETQDTYFIIEFKINASAQEALQQIENKKYYQSYESFDKKIILIGIAFDTSIRNVKEIEYKAYHQS